MEPVYLTGMVTTIMKLLEDMLCRAPATSVKSAFLTGVLHIGFTLVILLVKTTGCGTNKAHME